MIFRSCTLLSVRYDDTSHDVSIAYTSFCRRIVRTRLTHCLMHVLCFISLRTTLSATLLFQWFLSLRCHSLIFLARVFLVPILRNSVADLSTVVQTLKGFAPLEFCQYINQLHAQFPDASVLVVVPHGGSIHSGLCFVLLGRRNACGESGTEVAGQGTALPSPLRWRHRVGFIITFPRRAN